MSNLRIELTGIETFIPMLFSPQESKASLMLPQDREAQVDWISLPLSHPPAQSHFPLLSPWDHTTALTFNHMALQSVF